MTDIVEIDARRLFCPLPVIKLQNCIGKQPPGTRVRITSTDPGSLNDIPTWCRISGHAVLEIDDLETEFVFLVQKGDDES
ncbi:MAG: sulfurtransferase TusA family protein [Gammaproteobacteria bacterium]|jgi:tRNA 2-thiouridine synthesizing protein A